MSIAAYMRRAPQTVKFLTEIGFEKSIWIEYPKISPVIMVDESRMSPENKSLIKLYRDKSFLELMELWINAFCFGDGPKVFRPTFEQLMALEKMRLNIEVKDFCSPFPMITMEFPQAYKDHLGFPKLQFARLFHDKPNNMFITNMAVEKCALKTWWRPNDDQMVEEWLKEYNFDEYDFRADGGLPATDHEVQAEACVRRVMLNFCLLLDEVGIKKDGPASPNEYAQLVKWCKKNNKHTPANRIKLWAQPIVYKLKVETQLVRVVASDSELPAGEPGRKMPAHSRRGHYKMQAHGVGRTERKRIRIPPVVVNAHLLTGPEPAKVYVS